MSNPDSAFGAHLLGSGWWLHRAVLDSWRLQRCSRPRRYTPIPVAYLKVHYITEKLTTIQRYKMTRSDFCRHKISTHLVISELLSI